MSNNPLKLLETMLADMENADPLYKPTRFWQSACDAIIKELREQGVERFKSLRTPLQFFVPSQDFPGFYREPKIYDPIRSALDSSIQNSARFQLRLQNMMSGQDQAMADYRVFKASSTNSRPFLDRVSESEVGAPLAAGDGVDLVTDDVADRPKRFSCLRGEQKVERLRRCDQDVRGVFLHPPAVDSRCVTGPQEGGDLG